jgi:hypothetical protein
MKITPCINCKVKPVITEDNSNNPNHLVHDEPTCPFKVHIHHFTKDEAIKRWNEYYNVEVVMKKRYDLKLGSFFGYKTKDGEPCAFCEQCLLEFF